MNKMDEDNITLYCIGCKPDVTALKDFLYETICSNKASNNVMLRDPCSLSRAQLFIEQSEEFDDQEIVEYIVTTLHEVPPSGEVAYHSPPKLINQLCECRVKQRSVIGGIYEIFSLIESSEKLIFMFFICRKSADYTEKREKRYQ
jgi:hypothetical protein